MHRLISGKVVVTDLSFRKPLDGAGMVGRFKKLMTSFYFLMTTEGKVGSKCNRPSKPQVYSGAYGNLQEYRMRCSQRRESFAADLPRIRIRTL
jgi:hypothetical protein